MAANQGHSVNNGPMAMINHNGNGYDRGHHEHGYEKFNYKRKIHTGTSNLTLIDL